MTIPTNILTTSLENIRKLITQKPGADFRSVDTSLALKELLETVINDYINGQHHTATASVPLTAVSTTYEIPLFIAERDALVGGVRIGVITQPNYATCVVDVIKVHAETESSILKTTYGSIGDPGHTTVDINGATATIIDDDLQTAPLDLSIFTGDLDLAEGDMLYLKLVTGGSQVTAGVGIVAGVNYTYE